MDDRTGMIKPELLGCLAKRCSTKLLKHCQGTARAAAELARLHGADPAKAELCGLLHDYAKPCSKQELLDEADKLGLKLDQVTIEAGEKLLHAPVGAAMLRRDLGIADEAVLQAIARHTTGHSEMSLLDRIVYLADYIEETRTYPGVEQIRCQARSDIDGALLSVIEATILRVVERGLLLHTQTVAFRNSILLGR